MDPWPRYSKYGENGTQISAHFPVPTCNVYLHRTASFRLYLTPNQEYLRLYKEYHHRKNTAAGYRKNQKSMQQIKDNDLAKYDIVIRAWALDEPLVAEMVERVDRERFEYIKSLFAEMGFTGNELEVRTILFQAYHSLSPALQGAFFEESRLKHINVRHKFFIQKNDEDL